jgi:hypothetical protein
LLRNVKKTVCRLRIPETFVSFDND